MTDQTKFGFQVTGVLLAMLVALYCLTVYGIALNNSNVNNERCVAEGHHWYPNPYAAGTRGICK